MLKISQTFRLGYHTRYAPNRVNVQKIKANFGPLDVVLASRPPQRVGLAMLGAAAYKAKRARAPAAKTMAKLAPLTAAAPVGTTAMEDVAEPVLSP